MQGTYAILVGTVAVLVILVLIALIARQYRESGGIDSIAKILPAFFVVIVAVIVLGQIADIGQDDDPEPEPEPEPGNVSYSFNASTGTLTIMSDVPDGYDGPWDSYAEDVKSLVIVNGVNSVGDGTLSSLTALESLTMPDGVIFGNDALGVELKDVFGEDTTSEGEYAGLGAGTLYLCDPEIFTYSSNRTSITGLTETGRTAMTLVIPGTVSQIANGTSSSGTLSGGVFTLVLHTANSRLQTIGSFAFYDCTALETVDIPSSVTSIGASALRRCTALETVDIPSSVTNIGGNTFSGCTALETVDIPSSVTSIGSYAFYGCTALETVNIPSSVTNLNTFVFYGCSALETVNIPSSVTSIGASAFDHCTGLKVVDIPSSVTSIGSYAFGTCTSITSVSFGSDFAATLDANWASSWTFYDTDGTTVINKTVAANLAGSIFQGTAAALVKVLEGSRSLTPDQIQKVRLHDAELQDLKDRITFDPLPIRPSLEEELTA